MPLGSTRRGSGSDSSNYAPWRISERKPYSQKARGPRISSAPWSGTSHFTERPPRSSVTFPKESEMGDQDKMTPEERRELRDPLYVLATSHHTLLGHTGLFKDCQKNIYIMATGALDSLDTSSGSMSTDERLMWADAVDA